MKILEILVEDNSERLVKKAHQIYHAFKSGTVTLTSKGNKKKTIKYVLPDDYIVRLPNNDDEVFEEFRNSPTIKVDEDYVQIYDEEGSRIEYLDLKFHRLLMEFLIKKFEIFNILFDPR
jgi:hypothetical protein